jgi:glycosyltransferase involved in cell wall biosynthesis
MIKILHVSHSDITVDSRILKMISVGLNSRYNILALGVGLDEGLRAPETIKGATIKSFNVRPKNQYGLPKVIGRIYALTAMMISQFIWGYRYKADLIHCHDVVCLPVSVALKILTGASLVYDAHELESDRNGLSGSQKKFIFILEKCCWRFIDFFITVSYSIDRWYKEKYGFKKSEVILNSPVQRPSNNSFFPFALRDEFGVHPKTPLFINVGQFSAGRGIDIMLAAFEKLQDEAAIVFMGFGCKVDVITKFSADCSNIFFKSPVSHDEVVSVCSSADYGIALIEDISLSDYFSLPNKLFEYCFSGLPVIGSNFPDIADIIDEYKIGLTSEVSVDALVSTVRQIIAEGERIRSERFGIFELSWDRQAEKLSEVYASLSRNDK